MAPFWIAWMSNSELSLKLPPARSILTTSPLRFSIETPISGNDQKGKALVNPEKIHTVFNF